MEVNTLVYILILWSILRDHKSQGIQFPTQKLDVEEQYAHLNKPTVKTIKTEYADIYDCVDFYKQLAFDHPDLKNHNFHPQMRPSFVHKRTKKSTQKQEILIDSIRLKNGGCPRGTVPIRRMSKHDLIQVKKFTEHYATRNNGNAIPPEPGTNFAVVQTKSAPGKEIYYGIGGRLSYYNVSVGPSQFSAGQMTLQNGNDKIQVGWIVNPTLNKDNRTRLYQYLSTSQSHCFNTLCPGFVSVSQDIPIDSVLQPVSELGLEPQYLSLFIVQDEKNGNWWLEIGKEGTEIGFWPQQIFTGMAKSASYIAVGGETLSTPGQPLPPMGSSHFPKFDWDISTEAHCRNMFIVNDNRKQVQLPKNLENFSSNKDAYDVIDLGSTKRFERIIFYGGPGSGIGRL